LSKEEATVHVARWIRVLPVALVLALLATMVALVQPAAADTTTFECGGPGLDPAQGATYTNEAAKATNYGADPLVLTREGSGQKRYAFFECIVSALPAGATVTSATLNITAKSGTNTTATVRVHQRSADFAEGTLNWNTQGSPAFNATVLAQKTGFAFDERWSPSVSSVVTGNGSFRFALSRPPGQTTPQVQSFASDDHGTVAHRPTLTVNWTPPTPADQINLGHWRNRPSDAGLTWRQTMDAAEAQFGPFEGHWRNYKGVGSAGTLNTAEQQALVDGKRLFINWKPWTTTWKQVADGLRDAQIQAAADSWAANCDDNGECWITFGHEPEDDIGGAGSGMTIADHKAMFQRASTIFATRAPEVKVVWTMMGFETHQPKYPQLWPGAGYVDYIGHDPYVSCDGDPALMATRIVNRSVWFRNNLTGASNLPVVVAEWGADLGGNDWACGTIPPGQTEPGDRGTSQHRADAITGVRNRLPDIVNAGVIELDFFDAGSDYFSANNVTNVDTAAYEALKAATE
jgi:hypothetical protein